MTKNQFLKIPFVFISIISIQVFGMSRASTFKKQIRFENKVALCENLGINMPTLEMGIDFVGKDKTEAIIKK